MAKNIKGISIEIEGNTQPLERALESVNKQSQKTLAELKKIDGGLKFNPNSIELLKQKQDVLNEAIANSSEKLKQLKDAKSQVDTQFKNGEIGIEQYREFNRELEKTETSIKSYKSQLENLGQEQKRLSDSKKQLNTLIKATGKQIDDYRSILGDKLVNSIKNGTATSKDLDKAIKKIGDSSLDAKVDVVRLKDTLAQLDDNVNIDAINAKISSIGTTSAAAATGTTNRLLTGQNIALAAQSVQQIGNQIKDFGNDAIDAFKEVDKGMDIIIKKTGTTGKAELEELEKMYKQLATEIPVDNFDIVGSAVGELNTQFGFTGDTLKENSALLIKYADITDSDVTTSTLNAKQVMSAWGLQNHELERALNAVSGVAQQTGISSNELMNSLTKQAPILENLGLSYENSALLIGKLNQEGLDSDKVFTSLTKAQGAFAKEGKNVTQGMSDLKQRLAETNDETEQLTIANELFGVKNGAYMLKALKDNKLSFEDLSASASSYSGTVNDTFETTLDPIDRQKQALNSQKKAMAELGAEISQSMQPILDGFIKAMKGIADMFKGLPEPVKQFVVVLGGLIVALGAIAPIITMIGTAASAAQVPLSAVILPFLGIAAAIAALIVVIMNWDSIWKAIVAAFDATCQFVGQVFNGVVQGISDGLSTLGSFMSDIWNGIANTVSSVWNGITSTISGAINGAKDAVKGAIDAIVGFFNFKWSWPHIPLPHFSISGSLNPLDWFSQGLPSIGVEWYAKGGIMTKPTIFGANGNNLMVGGEAGNEAILPLNKETLKGIGIGIAETMSTSSSGIVINIENMTVRDDRDIKKIAKELVEEIELTKGRERRLGGFA